MSISLYICHSITQYVEGYFFRFFFFPLTGFLFKQEETNDNYRILLFAGSVEKFFDQGLGFRSKLVAALRMFSSRSAGRRYHEFQQIENLLIAWVDLQTIFLTNKGNIVILFLCLMWSSAIIRNKSNNWYLSILCQFLSTLSTSRKCSLGLLSGARSPSTTTGSRCSYLTLRPQVLCQGKLFSV